MEYHMDRRLKVVSNTMHKSLYTLCINEIDENDNVIGRDYIPWIWSLRFSASRISISDDLNILEPYNVNYNLLRTEDVSFKNDEHSVRDSRCIVADLYPDNVPFIMFGSDRAIKNFYLTIRPIGEGEGTESCSLWGLVSWTRENEDFISQTSPDEIGFDLMVKPSIFERYVERISLGTADEIHFSAGRVAGFYSRWNPSISTNMIKVLARGREQELQIPADLKFEPPRLGSIGECSLQITASRITQSGRLIADPEKY
jgi:hypothetical protein